MRRRSLIGFHANHSLFDTNIPRPVECAEPGQPQAANPGRKLESVAPLELPSWAGELRLTGIHAFDRQWDVTLAGGDVEVTEA